MTNAALPAPGPAGQLWHVAASAPVASGQRLPPGTDPAGLSRFGEDRWDLSPLSRRHHEAGRAINWAAFPADLRAGFKRAGWALLNLPNPRAAARTRSDLPRRAPLDRHDHRSHAELAPLRCLAGRPRHYRPGPGRLRLPRALRRARRPAASPCAAQAAALSAVSVLWGFALHLPAGDRIPMPPWEAEGLRHYLPAARGSNENATAPVHPPSCPRC